MSNPRGGAEAHARSKHYVYRANTSLVLTGENRSRDTHEPTEETETLSGKIDPKSFGDRVAKGKPQEFEDKFKKFKKKQRDAGDDDVTKESRDAYEAMLSLIQRQLGGGPLNVANGAANKILAVLKNDAVNNHVKKVEIQKLLKPTPEEVDQVFNQFVSIGRFITDFQEGGDSCGGEGDEDGGLDVDFDVAVEFGGGANKWMRRVILIWSRRKKTKRMKNLRELVDIGAYLLQRKISQTFEQKIDPQHCQVLAEELLKILAEGDDRDVENKLLVHLQFEKFSLVKFLLRNRFKVVWCTRLERAKDQCEKNQIEEEMRGLGPELVAIVEQSMDQREVLVSATRLLQAMVDVISSNGWLNLALRSNPDGDSRHVGAGLNAFAAPSLHKGLGQQMPREKH
ncbi:hypothetical protein Bca52824_063473 [Brassica carinata]|uniref:Brr2 N-terminal helicase PWI domain-containing protein n=1 Tax=Brassica carinata TaxID=52824 RepID=A0A8X7QG69_BRACI|nr:hypothetical protein Bca52824_063473 [Brassica carinata]